MRLIFIFLFLLLSSVVVSVHGQEGQEACPAITWPEETKAAVNLKRHVVSSVSFCLPTELEEVKGTCYEGGCGLFESKRFRVSIDANLAAWRPTSDKYLPTYEEKFVTIDGKPAWIWSFHQPKREFPYTYGTLVKRKTDKYDFGLYFSSTELGHEDLSKVIFQSIRFSPKY